jgi:putative peptidoglycan lipid II flippase
VLVVYIGFLALLRAPELTPALAIARRFLPGRR